MSSPSNLWLKICIVNFSQIFTGSKQDLSVQPMEMSRRSGQWDLNKTKAYWAYGMKQGHRGRWCQTQWIVGLFIGVEYFKKRNSAWNVPYHIVTTYTGVELVE